MRIRLPNGDLKSGVPSEPFSMSARSSPPSDAAIVFDIEQIRGSAPSALQILRRLRVRPERLRDEVCAMARWPARRWRRSSEQPTRMQ